MDDGKIKIKIDEIKVGKNNFYFIKEITCPLCENKNKRYSSIKYLQEHVTKCHYEKVIVGYRTRYPCPFEECGMVLKSENSVNIHFMNLHWTFKEEYICHKCQMFFTSKCFYDKHSCI